ncbi:LLM class flavin-dependent oxidoreductase [Paenibacillus ginsengarvi]|uniref:LLM class flavin-dependent oxidoreductase n=1 Tax=Paenibacillus ginsengarvi TaxID=400777 RepID=A0A3B0CH22_9BACL|nr:LLM class flavin-dependent oxidoreductase [Paenibacillus ginsengarvi]RKN84440.1 LLM class flavin-dependent oxidoreductase [Paenibacillus ginsengarvi]
MEIGIYTFADLCRNPHTGEGIGAKQRLREIVDAAKLADEAGLDVFGVGEHHRLEYAASAPAIVLSSVAQVTKRIKLTSATTVLGTIDPVRLFQDFATLDLLSDGRAEIIAGRGAFRESFPLFGYDVALYDELFQEHLELLLQLRASEKITWSGRHRPALEQADIAPRPAQSEIPIWVAVGSSVDSAARAGKLGTHLAIMALGGSPYRFQPFVEAYREAAAESGHDAGKLKIGVTSHAYIAKTSKQARDEFYPYYMNYWKENNRQHGMISRLTRTEYEWMSAPDTVLFVGSTQQIVEKILRQHEMFGHQRFIAQVDIGGIPFGKVASTIERLALEVAPAVRKALRTN